jgi:cystathionine beta-lyase/cystathionine gamma-synthase
MVRLSVGLEDVEDLIEDLGQALDVLNAPRARRAAE